MITLLLFLYFTCTTIAQTTVKSFSASAIFTKNGRINTVDILYDYDATKLSQIISFSDGTTTREVYDYDKGILFSMCSDSPNSCQSVAWNLGQWIWFINSTQSGINDNLNGNPAVRFDIAQPNGWSSSLWFSIDSNSQGFNSILRAMMTKGENIQSYDFTNVISPITTPNPFSVSSSCGFNITCFSQLDLVLVLDDSDSVSDDSWSQALSFATSLVGSFPKIGERDVRVGVITFATNAVLQIGVSKNKTAILNTLNNIVRIRTETGIAEAINLAQNTLVQAGRNAPRAIIIITDGVPNIPPPNSLALSLMMSAAQSAKDAGTTIYAIGVGDLTNIDTMNLIASAPRFVSYVQDYSSLSSIQDTLVQSVCIGENTDNCNPTCDSSDGFCACGKCKCLKSCTNFTAGCYTGQCNSIGVCYPALIPGCCPLTNDDCLNKGTIPDTSENRCFINASNPCNCQNWCGNGTNAPNCSCICDQRFIKDENGACTICNTTAANAIVCGGRGTIDSTCSICTCRFPFTGPNCDQCLNWCENGVADFNNSCNCICNGNWLLNTTYLNSTNLVWDNFTVKTNSRWTIETYNASFDRISLGYVRSDGYSCSGVPKGCLKAIFYTTPALIKHPNIGPLIAGRTYYYKFATQLWTLQTGSFSIQRDSNPYTIYFQRNLGTFAGYATRYFSGVFVQPETAKTQFVFTFFGGIWSNSIYFSDITLIELAVKANISNTFTPAVCNKCDVTAASIACNNRGTVANLTTCSGCICRYPFIGPTCNQCPNYCVNGVIADEDCNCRCNASYWLNWNVNSTCTTCFAGGASGTFCNSRGDDPSCNGSRCICRYPSAGRNCQTCEDYCGVGGTAVWSRTCACSCRAPFYLNTTAPFPNCTMCNATLGTSLICNGRGFFNATSCSSCICNGNWTGGAINGSRETTNCSLCGLTNSTCGNGYVAINNCSCICTPPWTLTNITNACTTCNTTRAGQMYCNGRGVPSNGCSGACVCSDGWSGINCTICNWNNTVVDCVNGEYRSGGCGCICSDYWGKDSSGKCTVCDTQLYSDTFCSGRGTVLTNPDTKYCTSCQCPSEWTGSNCSICSRNDSYCNGLGSINSNCTCNCLPNVIGSTCQNCTLNCNGRGTPNSNCSACICTPPWTGANCSVCTRNSSFCVRGTFNSTLCLCNCVGNSTGDNCSACPFGCTIGVPNTNCTGCTCPSCINGVSRSTDCFCRCDQNWLLDSNKLCTICNSTAGVTVCNNRGNITQNNCTDCICRACSNGGINDRYCNCQCTSPWAQNPITLDCTICTATSLSLCNGLGTPNSTCNGCICQTGYSGSFCNQCSNTSFCGQGVLTVASSCTRCQCPIGSGWIGDRCQNCTWNCNGKGDSNSNCNGCNCNSPWTGSNCEICSRSSSFCTNGVFNSTNCSCICPPGFAGEKCDQCIYSQSDCGDRGTLNASSCSCDCVSDLFTSTLCDQCTHPSNFCENGLLNTSDCTTCICNENWQGDKCTVCGLTNDFCQNGGTVDLSTCTCTCAGGFSGSDCSSCLLSSSNCSFGFDSSSCSCICDPATQTSGPLCNRCDKVECVNGVPLTNVGISNCRCLCFGSFTSAKCDTCGLQDGSCNAGTLNSTSCSCICPDYWRGERCSWCGLVDCGRNQEPNYNTCRCDCIPPWTGPSCQVCPLTCVEGSTLNLSTCECICENGCNSTNECLISPGYCNKTNGECTWINKPIGSICDDKDLCTGISTCNEGNCITLESSRRMCTALSQCHVEGICEPSTGLCSNPVNIGASCSDGDWCTISDTCLSNAICSGIIIDSQCTNDGGAVVLQTTRSNSIYATQSAWIALQFKALADISEFNVTITNFPTIEGSVEDYTYGFINYPANRDVTQPFKKAGIDYLSTDFIAFKMNPPQSQDIEDISVTIQVDYFWNDKSTIDTRFFTATIPVIESSGKVLVLTPTSPLAQIEVGRSAWVPINIKALSRLTNFQASISVDGIEINYPSGASYASFAQSRVLNVGSVDFTAVQISVPSTATPGLVNANLRLQWVSNGIETMDIPIIIEIAASTESTKKKSQSIISIEGLEVNVHKGDDPQWSLFSIVANSDISDVKATIIAPGVTIGHMNGDSTNLDSISAGIQALIPFSVLGDIGSYSATLIVNFKRNGVSLTETFNSNINIVPIYIEIGTNLIDTNQQSTSIPYSLATQPLNPLSVDVVQSEPGITFAQQQIEKTYQDFLVVLDVNVDDSVPSGQYPVTLEFSYQGTDLVTRSNRATFWAVVDKSQASKTEEKENSSSILIKSIGGGVGAFAAVALVVVGIIARRKYKKRRIGVLDKSAWPFQDHYIK